MKTFLKRAFVGVLSLVWQVLLTEWLINIYRRTVADNVGGVRVSPELITTVFAVLWVWSAIMLISFIVSFESS